MGNRSNQDTINDIQKLFCEQYPKSTKQIFHNVREKLQKNLNLNLNLKIKKKLKF